jgi:hypothetical protein
MVEALHTARACVESAAIERDNHPRGCFAAQGAPHHVQLGDAKHMSAHSFGHRVLCAWRNCRVCSEDR